jgi:hypothetical protein
VQRPISAIGSWRGIQAARIETRLDAWRSEAKGRTSRRVSTPLTRVSAPRKPGMRALCDTFVN